MEKSTVGNVRVDLQENDLEALKGFLKEHWDLEGELEPLVGYEDLNMCLRTAAGPSWLVKLHLDRPGLDSEQLKAENDLLLQLADGQVPTPVPRLSGGQSLLRWADRGWVRVLSFLPGEVWGTQGLSLTMLESLASSLAVLDRKLAEIDLPRLHLRRHDWDLSRLAPGQPSTSSIRFPALRSICAHFLYRLREQLHAKSHLLPHQLIHNDANEYNVLVSGGRTSGIIDFGDLVYAPRIQELGACLPYYMVMGHDPLETATAFLRSYHAHNPLLAEELDLLFDFMGARAALSFAKSEAALQADPDNAYVQISSGQMQDFLRFWVRQHPQALARAWKTALGLPVPPGPDDMAGKRQRYFSQSMSLSYRETITMESATMQYMHAQDGRSYLDMVNNIMHVGHGHPQVVEAAHRASLRLNTNTRYHYPELTRYAERLLQHFPPELNKVFLVNSGSAATDLALRLAQASTGSDARIIVQHGYHGNTQTGISVSSYKHDGKGGSGPQPNVHALPMPDPLRGPDAASSLQVLEQTLHQLTGRGTGAAAFIAESILGCGGQMPLPPGYLREVYAAVRAQGGVCIADEVQTGFGRVGTHFWAYEAHGVRPDIVVLGKPIANGHPMGAVVCTEAVCEAFENGMEFFSSFGGNPVSCAIGLAVLDVIREEDLQERALRTGQMLGDGLRALAAEDAGIADVRGSGLFWGVECTLAGGVEPDAERASLIVEAMKARGILLSTDGPWHNVLKIKPPMCFDEENAEEFLHKLAECLREIPAS